MKIAETKNDLDDYLGKENKIAYCFVEYGAPYAPKVEVVANNVRGTFNYEMKDQYLEYKPFVAGACALIPKTESFTCKAAFGQPPISLIQDITYDVSAPSEPTVTKGGTVPDDSMGNNSIIHIGKM